MTDSPLSVTNIAQMAMFYIKLSSLNDFLLEEGQLVQMVSLNKILTVSVTDSPLSVTNIAEMATGQFK